MAGKLKLINDICDLFKKDTINRSNKQQVKCNYEIWTDNGWQKILRVIRHKTNKKIYRVSSGLGIVDVTEDNSLCNSDKIPIKPNELEIIMFVLVIITIGLFKLKTIKNTIRLDLLDAHHRL